MTNASANLTWYYHREGDSTSTQVTLASMTLGTWASGGFVEIDATNMPGWYEIGIPDACINANTNPFEDIGMCLRGATNMEDVNFEWQLKSDFNPIQF